MFGRSFFGELVQDQSERTETRAFLPWGKNRGYYNKVEDEEKFDAADRGEEYDRFGEGEFENEDPVEIVIDPLRDEEVEATVSGWKASDGAGVPRHWTCQKTSQLLVRYGALEQTL
jgi:hypothetical protein